MQITGISDKNVLNVKPGTGRKKTAETAEKKRREIAEINLESSKVDIGNFEQARKMADDLAAGIDRLGTGLINKERLTGNRIFDLLNE